MWECTPRGEQCLLLVLCWVISPWGLRRSQGVPGIKHKLAAFKVSSLLAVLLLHTTTSRLYFSIDVLCTYSFATLDFFFKYMVSDFKEKQLLDKWHIYVLFSLGLEEMIMDNMFKSSIFCNHLKILGYKYWASTEVKMFAEHVADNGLIPSTTSVPMNTNRSDLWVKCQ